MRADMTTHASSEKLLRPRDAVLTATRGDTRGLSAEILRRSARRLRILALMYAFTFFMAGYVPNLIFADARAMMLSSALYWLPGIIAIAMALVVAALTVYAALPLSTMIAFSMVGLLEGSYFVETLTGVPGIGRLSFESIGGRDYDMIMALTLVGTTAFVIVSISVDIVYTLIDPRIRYGSRGR